MSSFVRCVKNGPYILFIKISLVSCPRKSVQGPQDLILWRIQRPRAKCVTLVIFPKCKGTFSDNEILYTLAWDYGQRFAAHKKITSPFLPLILRTNYQTINKSLGLLESNRLSTLLKFSYLWFVTNKIKFWGRIVSVPYKSQALQAFSFPLCECNVESQTDLVNANDSSQKQDNTRGIHLKLISIQQHSFLSYIYWSAYKLKFENVFRIKIFY